LENHKIMLAQSTLLKKIITCLIASLTTIALLLVLGNSGTLVWFPPVVVFSLVGISFISALIFPFVWQYQEKKNTIDSERIYGILYATIRYTIAFNLASFGWKKIFDLQFVVPDEIAQKPMNQQSGEWLTWYYFGYSKAFGFCIALIQIIGSYFLLFRKTLLLASVVLFAFMNNLLMINIFYHLNAGALTQSVLLTLGITFLISLEYDKLVVFFLKTTSNLPSINFKNALLKHIIRISAIVLSLLFTLYLKSLIH
jgi:hypothetical protein